jgi:FMN phosphatase YigB (HAD superfamily)
MISKKYKNLIFDFGKVIIDIDDVGAIERVKKLLINESAFEEALPKYETGKIGTDAFINKLISQAKPKVQALDVIQAWNSMLIGIPASRLKMLEELKPKYNLYLLSNTNELHIEWIHRHLLKDHGIKDFETRFWNKVYYSHLVKERKPNPAIFEHVIKDAGIIPEETLFMDDTEEHLYAASQLGFDTYLVRKNEEIGKYLKKEGFF